MLRPGLPRPSVQVTSSRPHPRPSLDASSAWVKGGRGSRCSPSRCTTEFLTSYSLWGKGRKEMKGPAEGRTGGEDMYAHVVCIRVSVWQFGGSLGPSLWRFSFLLFAGFESERLIMFLTPPPLSFPSSLKPPRARQPRSSPPRRSTSPTSRRRAPTWHSFVPCKPRPSPRTGNGS